MPLFTILSGFVYAYKPVLTDYGKFFRGKSRRLLLPLLTVGTAYAIVQHLIPGTNNSVENWFLLHIEPVAHFWFLESIFIIFALVAFVEKALLFDNFLRFFLVFFGALALYLSSINYQYFGVSGAIYLLPFFLMGMAINRYFTIELLQPQLKTLAGLLSIGVVLLVVFIEPGAEKRSIVGFVAGAVFCCSLIVSQFKNKLLAKIGVYSFSIYLFHVFFTAATRMGLEMVDEISVFVIIVSCISMGILGPVLVEIVFSKSAVLNTAFLGQRWKKSNIVDTHSSNKHSTRV